MDSLRLTLLPIRLKSALEVRKQRLIAGALDFGLDG